MLMSLVFPHLKKNHEFIPCRPRFLLFRIKIFNFGVPDTDAIYK